MVRTGTSSWGDMCAKNLWQTIPLSRAMAKIKRLALVMLADVPLMKQMLSMSARIVAAAREEVLWRNSSTIGMPVELVRMVVGSVRQKSITKIKNRPLRGQ